MFNKKFNSMPNGIFSYENLNQHFITNNGGPIVEPVYVAGKGNGKFIEKGFLFLRKVEISKNVSQEGRIFSDLDLKFHISIPEDNRHQYADAWNIIKDILINYEVGLFKVAHENAKMSSAKGQQGKDITIYTKRNSEKTLQDWQTILQKITERLVAANIPPGYQTSRIGPRADKAIRGSNYISYRYEKGEPEQDFCAQLEIDVPGQLEPQLFSHEELTLSEASDENWGPPPLDEPIADQAQDETDSANTNCCKKCVII